MPRYVYVWTMRYTSGDSLTFVHATRAGRDAAFDKHIKATWPDDLSMPKGRSERARAYLDHLEEGGWGPYHDFDQVELLP